MAPCLRSDKEGLVSRSSSSYIINHPKSQGINIKYIFTNLGASLVNAAAKQFKGTKGTKGLLFDVLDVEKLLKPQSQGVFHYIITTDWIHATRNLVSLWHARQMLPDDGALALVEIT
ncbi:uncharacterized protein NFIA_113480 [Aspergillus fischeri NRRL 181]|uniref:Uncharacterized protein n=1 Tax=Neosartorya fischeri (strain ATCC 1020 / DSM 3700 / CBS 544.65 / FGSC A1164 / JCM 1740 / NRRL 181 / WB 181) TaxID=331117 RepID=A1D8V7_NEOFI|nr:uncharacterized protein NFIA_113480 [Aspergillus fischeri NRRL 181]EAW20818.1 hypothetical protein NFIA_113480 [Aspergillus fischeri NRRL 181]KAG2002821.1 hypothetical protein GB937_009468 [Aspergillus fischeri]